MAAQPQGWNASLVRVVKFEFPFRRFVSSKSTSGAVGQVDNPDCSDGCLLHHLDQRRNRDGPVHWAPCQPRSRQLQLPQWPDVGGKESTVAVVFWAARLTAASPWCRRCRSRHGTPSPNEHRWMDGRLDIDTAALWQRRKTLQMQDGLSTPERFSPEMPWKLPRIREFTLERQ